MQFPNIYTAYGRDVIQHKICHINSPHHFSHGILHADLRSIGLTKYYSTDQIKKNEMGEACGSYGREERCVESFGVET
jgi:hypothetical protein